MSKYILIFIMLAMNTKSFSQSWKAFYHFQKGRAYNYSLEITDLNTNKKLKTSLKEVCTQEKNSVYDLNLTISKKQHSVKLDRYGNCLYQSSNFAHLFLVFPKYPLVRNAAYYFNITVDKDPISCRGTFTGKKLSSKGEFAQFSYIGSNWNEKISARISFDTQHQILYFIEVFYYNTSKKLKLKINKTLL